MQIPLIPLAHEDIDAVIVSMPHPQHAPIGVKVLGSGRHTLIQKPMATTMEDAERLVVAAEASDRVTMCLPCYFTPAFVATCDILDQGLIGTADMARSRVAHNAAGPLGGSTSPAKGRSPMGSTCRGDLAERLHAHYEGSGWRDKIDSHSRRVARRRLWGRGY